MYQMLLTAAAPTADAAAQGGVLNTIINFAPFVLIILVFYFLMIRPQKKRDKQIAEMRNRIDVGDEVITSGGIIGIVVSVREDSLVVETGTDRSKIRIARWAVQSNNTVKEARVEPSNTTETK